jgi:putative transposase
MDETYIRVKGEGCYLYRAVYKDGDTIDFMLSKKRDKIAAEAFCDKAIASYGMAEKVVIDKSRSNFYTLKEVNNSQEKNEKIEIHQIKYLNNIIEQDHRFIKKPTRPTKGFKSFKSAHATIKGIELHHMLHKKQFKNSGSITIFQQFYNLAA